MIHPVCTYDAWRVEKYFFTWCCEKDRFKKNFLCHLFIVTCLTVKKLNDAKFLGWNFLDEIFACKILDLYHNIFLPASVIIYTFSKKAITSFQIISDEILKLSSMGIYFLLHLEKIYFEGHSSLSCLLRHQLWTHSDCCWSSS